MGQGSSQNRDATFEDIDYFDDGSMLEPEWWGNNEPEEPVQAKSMHTLSLPRLNKTEPCMSGKPGMRIEPDLARHYGPGPRSHVFIVESCMSEQALLSLTFCLPAIVRCTLNQPIAGII